MKLQFKLMLYLKAMFRNKLLTCSNRLLPVCVLLPLSSVAGIYLYLFPWLLLVMMQHFARLFPPSFPQPNVYRSRNHIHRNNARRICQANVLKHLVYFPYLDDSKGKMEQCAVGEPLITQIFSVRFFIFSLAIISNLITFPGQLFALTPPFSVL